MTAIPFYSQMVNYQGEDSGFLTQYEIDRWERNCCGIACARMIIHYFAGKNIQYWPLLQEGLRLNAYNEIGWIHRGLVDLISRYGVAGEAHREKTVDELFGAMERGSICIVSASAGFRGGLKKKDSEEYFGKGGHLIVGFKNDKGEISCHHPSTLLEWNKADWVVPRDAWERSFSGGYMEFFR